MKFHKLLVFMMVFSLAVFAKSAFAQDDDDDDDDTGGMEEMDEDEWQAQMDEYTAKKTDLTNQLSTLNTEIEQLKFGLQTRQNDADNAVNAVWAAVGSKTQYEEYKGKFSDAEKRVNACKGPDDAADINANIMPYINDAGINNRMHCLNEFYDRWNSMKKKITECMGKVETGQYTVVKGDCLYKIAGMSSIYGNSRLWPAIWDANKSGVVSAPTRTPTTIPNPNLIYPGQVLKIPVLTEAQKTEALMNANSYRGSTKRRMKSDNTEMKTMKKDSTKK